MAWLACDEDGSEYIYNIKPIRGNVSFLPSIYEGKLDDIFKLPKGSIKKLIGRELKWEDSPVELK